MKNKKCVVCGINSTASEHGRFIDGTWFDDDKLPSEYSGKWVCSNECYAKLVKDKTVNGKGV